MTFAALLGNDRLKQNLSESLAKNHISHFYLICGPEGSGKRTLARLLSAAILGRSSEKAARKALEGSHPDVITVTDPEHKNVAVKIVRQIREDVFIRPNEAEHKIYIFPQELGLEGQNALLKILEEPPAYGVFLLLTDNPDKLLPTVRSRCTELKMQALPREILLVRLRRDFPQAQEDDLEGAVFRSGGFLGQARKLLEEGTQIPPQTADFVRAFSQGDALLLTQTLVPMEKWKRDALAELLAAWLELLESALANRSGLQAVSAQARQLAQSCTAARLHHGIVQLKKALDCTKSNVSSGAVCGYLAWMLR